MSELAKAIKDNRDQAHKIGSNPTVKLVWNFILLIAGIALFLNPKTGAEVIVMIIGVAMLVYGTVALVSDIAGHAYKSSDYFMPIIMLAVGILLIIFRVFTANALLPLIIGIYALYFGITNLAGSARNRTSGGYWKSQLVMSLIMIGLGIAVLAVMVGGSNAIGIILGICLIVFSVPGIYKWILSKFSANK